MKCIILLFALVAVCSAYPYGNTGGRSVHIGEDGTIVITGSNGKRITITKAIGNSGQKNIEIAISGPNIPTKRVQINEQNELRGTSLLDQGQGQDQGQGGEYDVSDEYQRDKRSSKRRSQGDTLSEILREYQGVVDDRAYSQLLSKVSSAVRSGLLSESVYDILQSLGQSQYPGVGQAITGQDDVLDLLQRQQQIEELLQQQYQQQQYQQGGQGGPLYVYGQQQIPQPFDQSRIGQLYGIGGRGIGSALQGVVLGSDYVPVGSSQGQIVERLLGQPQVIPYPTTAGSIYGPSGVQGTYGGWRKSVWQNLLNSYATRQGIPYGQYGQQETLAQIVQNEGAILNQQNQIQQQQVQQQLQQQQQQQQILQQQQQQQQQQQLLQQLQQLQQQQQLQQEQLQQQVWQQQQQQQQAQLQQQVQQGQYNPLTAYLLSRVGSTSGQRGGVWQQLGVYPQRSYVGVTGGQGIPVTGTVPLVL